MRRFIIPATGAAYIVGSALLVFAAIQFHNPETFAPISYENPVHAAGPISLADPAVTLTATRCNKSKEEVAVEATFGARNLDKQQLIPQAITIRRSDGLNYPTGGTVSSSSWKPGCTQVTATVVLAGLEPGTWRLEGTAVVRSVHNQTQVAPWYSEEFLVTN